MVEGKPAPRFLTPGLAGILEEIMRKRNGTGVQVRTGLWYYVPRAKVFTVARGTAVSDGY
jgi:hypothetical protein